MREIKFRAWVNSEYFHNVSVLVKNGEPHIYLNNYNSDAAVLPVNEKYFLEQYTGMKDKNGKEIYEGDILGRVAIYDDSLHIVTWFNYGFSMPAYFNPGMWKIVGNIHETPHLLNQE